MATAVGLAAVTGAASATMIGASYTGSTIDIPDGNPVGIASTLAVDDTSGGLNNAAVQDVSVSLNISGGYDGDLYGYLVYQPSTSASGSGAGTSMIVLLNQIGSAPFHDSTAGMNITLSDSGTANVNTQTGTALTSGTGVFTPDSSSGAHATFSSAFNGQSADGNWTLFLADLSTGGGTSELLSWGVNISVVPEPIAWALVGFAGVLSLARFVAWRKQVKSA